MLLAASVPALAMPRGNGLPVIKTQSAQLIKFRRGHYRRGYYRRGHYRHHNNGVAVVAGVIGLGAGLAIASNNRRYAYQSGSAEWKAACARKYRSFEPRTGLYPTYSGYKRRCRLP